SEQNTNRLTTVPRRELINALQKLRNLEFIRL
ncbi:MAG: hypothetical protein ACI9VS_003910, partial [Candidatus Binatia bacterium]